MAVLEDLKDAFTRAKSSKSRQGARATTEALDQLRETTVTEIARFAGQSLEELDATFELLPLGTRLALEQVGALELIDSAGDTFGVRVRPFAVDLVNAANERVMASAAPAEREDLETRVNDLVDEEGAVDLALEPVAATSTRDDEDEPERLLGTVRAWAIAEAIDDQSRLGVLRILDPDDTNRPAESLPAVTFALDRATGVIVNGMTAKVELVVTSRLPHAPGKATPKAPKGLGKVRGAGKVKDLKGHAPEVVAPGGVCIPVVLTGSKAKLVVRQAEAANALAKVTSVTSRDTVAP
jgi:hypothetical protein